MREVHQVALARASLDRRTAYIVFAAYFAGAARRPTRDASTTGVVIRDAWICMPAGRIDQAVGWSRSSVLC